MEQGTEDLLVQVVGVGDILAKAGWIYLVKQTGDVAEGGDFDQNPNRGPHHVQVMVVVLDELLFAAVHLLIELGQSPGVDQRISEVPVLQISEGTELMTHLVGPAGANRNFDALAPLDDQSAQLSIKLVKVPDLVEGCSGLEPVGLAGKGEGKAVGGEAVVVVMGQTVQREGLVGHDQAAILENLELRRIGRRGLTHAPAPSSLSDLGPASRRGRRYNGVVLQ